MENKKEDKFVDNLLNRYCLIDPSDIYAPKGKVELDLGCGKGSFTTALALKYPESSILAADIMTGRLRKLVKRNIRMKINNMTILKVEARHLVSYMLPDNSIDRIHLLCPDPWPKERHRQHRLMSSDFIGQIHRIVKNSGIFHFATDDTSYFETVANSMKKSEIFRRNDTTIDDVAHIKTDFELLWLNMGRNVLHGAWIAC